MPELPDVEVFNRYLGATAMRKKIDSVTVKTADVLKDTSKRSFQRQLRGGKFTSTYRHGKHLLVSFGTDRWLVMHFGMTGFLEYYKSDDDEPEYAKVIFHFANGYHLAYCNKRKLGFVTTTRDINEYVDKNDLGPDPLTDSWDKEDFIAAYSGRKGTIKSGLMNQSIMAGIGNVYSDEILFQSGIKPAKKIPRIADNELGKLFTTLKRVVKKAIDWKADPSEFPRTYLLRHRQSGDTCPKCGGTIKKATVGGRSSYYCPSHQT